MWKNMQKSLVTLNKVQKKNVVPQWKYWKVFLNKTSDKKDYLDRIKYMIFILDT